MKDIENLGFTRAGFGGHFSRVGPFHMYLSFGHENEMYVRVEGPISTIYLHIETTEELKEAVLFFEDIAKKMKQ